MISEAPEAGAVLSQEAAPGCSPGGPEQVGVTSASLPPPPLPPPSLLATFMPPTCLLPPINTPVLQTGVPATGKDGDTHPHEASGALGPAAGEEEEAQGWRQLPVRSLLQLPTNLRLLPPAGLNTHLLAQRLLPGKWHHHRAAATQPSRLFTNDEARGTGSSGDGGDAASRGSGTGWEPGEVAPLGLAREGGAALLHSAFSSPVQPQNAF